MTARESETWLAKMGPSIFTTHFNALIIVPNEIGQWPRILEIEDEFSNVRSFQRQP